VPHGANLMSNTSGTLVGVVLSPVTWLWGPVAATNVALTLAPGLSAWGCWVALRRFVDWKPGTIPAALVYGYSAAVVTSLTFGHISVTVLPVPPLLLATLYAIVVRQTRSPRREGLILAALVVVQFLISPEILVMCLLLAVIGLALTAAVAWRKVSSHLAYATKALGIGVGLSAALLAYPAWFGLSGPQAVSGLLFADSALAGVRISGYLSPGPYGASAGSLERFGGYVGRLGPPSNYLGWGTAAATAVAAFFGRRRLLLWLLVFLALVTMWLSLGAYLLGGSSVLWRGWMPWRSLSALPVLKEILPDQLAPLVPLFVAFVLALGLDALSRRVKAAHAKQSLRVDVLTGMATVAVALATLVPAFVTFGLPLTVQSTDVPAWMVRHAPTLPRHTVLLTVPFAVSGSTQPMLWQAVDDMHFRLAGAALKTPDAGGGPVGQGTSGSARRILTNLTVGVGQESKVTSAQLLTVRRAVRAWRVDEVVIGVAPRDVDRAWVWKIPAGGPSAPPTAATALARCGAFSVGSVARHHPLAMARCILGKAPSP
jgi:hypothetical protein